MKKHKFLYSKRIVLFLVILLLLFITNIGQANDYKLTTGDQLYISIWGYSDLQQDVVIGPNGQISFPMIGKVQTVGLTLDQLRSLMAGKLKKYIKIKESQVNIVFRKYEQVRVMILGEVNNPGAYQVRPGDQVLNLVSLAGGTTKVADMNNVQLKRDKQLLTVDLEALLTRSFEQKNYYLEEGDTVYVPQEIVEVSVLGEVKRPGSYKVKKGSKVSDILAKAGGATNDAGNKIKYISANREYSFSLDNLLNSENNNLVIKDGDTIKLLEGKYAFYKFSFWRNLFFLVGGLNQVKNLVN